MKQLTIFIADDDADDYNFIKEAFYEIKEQHCFEHLLDGEKLIKRLSACTINQLPDLIILDINMPRMDGLGALKLIRSRRRFNRLPVIMYSTSDDPDQAKQCYQAGANSFVTKGCSLSDFQDFAKFVTGFMQRLEGFMGELPVINSIAAKTRI